MDMYLKTQTVNNGYKDIVWIVQRVIILEIKEYVLKWMIYVIHTTLKMDIV